MTDTLFEAIVVRKRRTRCLFAVAAVLSVASATVFAENDVENEAKKAGHAIGSAAREVGKAAKEAGRAIGQGAKKVGKSVGEAAKEGGRAVKRGVKGES